MRIIINDVFKKYDGKVILDNINENFESGFIYVITGDSGCGKTTFLNILSGITLPDKGFIKFGNEILNKKNLDIYRNKIGIMLQNSFLINDLTLIENLDFFKIPLKETTSFLIRELELEDRMNIKAAALSVGERQRVSLIRVLSLQPEIIFADEPTASLDRKNADLINKYLEEFITDKNKTVFLVTHKEDIDFKAYKKIQLNNGKIKMF